MKYKMTVAQVTEKINAALLHNFGVSAEDATDEHIYKATALLCRDLMSQGYEEFSAKALEQGKKQVYYLCMEFLLGRSLKNNLYNLGLTKTVESALLKMGVNIEKIYDQEPDAGLGNGGLGRLASCFLDGLATQGYPAMGYSLRYEYGIFSQKLVDGWQTELPDFWLPGGRVWLEAHKEEAVEISFNGAMKETWVNGIHGVSVENDTKVIAVPYDMYVSGYNGKGISKLRLWAADSNAFDMKLFNDGEYMRAVEQKAMAESITKVLYPGDNHEEGKSLRLNQQYFLVSATVQDIIQRHLKQYRTLENLSEKTAIHLNDTHPVLAVPELMRILMDDCGFSWDKSWDIVTKTIAYTNHTVMAEALETWNEDMFRRKLPRIYQIVEEINKRYCRSLQDRGVDHNQIGRMAVISNGFVKMANLAVVASHKVNGVSALHSKILTDTVFNDYYRLTPDKFTNVTNGIAHRRWLNQSNPRLSALLDELIGPGYITDAAVLSNLEQYKNDDSVLDKLAKIKLENKADMAKYIKMKNNIVVDPSSVFDVQVKRLHEYKRQLLNALHILSTYQWLRENPNADFVPKTYIFGAKAAPGYYFAKQIIQFIIALSQKINNDPMVNQKLKVVYLEDYRVTVAEKLMPASELSEQISLAGTEASGTGNMKFMINGALTIGTLDGANVEIHQAVGDENMFLFGMTTPEVNRMQSQGYSPREYYNNNPVIRRAVDEISQMGFGDISNSLLNKDPYMVLADFADYSLAQQRASVVYKDYYQFNRMSLMNIAKAGIFASDRSIRDYANSIWGMTPVEE